MSTASSTARVLGFQMLWDASSYNAFTTLIHHQGEFFCAFREAATHLSDDGVARILVSPDATTWTSAAAIAWPKGDVRDPKLAITSAGKLLLLCGVRLTESQTLRSTAWLSADGRRWGEGKHIADPGVWLWGVTWHRNAGYGFGYGDILGSSLNLYTTTDGKTFDLRAAVPIPGSPSEHGLTFLPDDTAVCLLRRDNKPREAMIGIAKPPYTEWSWTSVGQFVGGPAILRIPDGRIVASGRLLDDRSYQRVGLCWIDPVRRTMQEFLTLPGAQQEGPARYSGDWGYPGLAWHNNILYVSYYSAHEGKTRIYLAQVQLPPDDGAPRAGNTAT